MQKQLNKFCSIAQLQKIDSLYLHANSVDNKFEIESSSIGIESSSIGSNKKFADAGNAGTNRCVVSQHKAHVFVQAKQVIVYLYAKRSF